MADERWCGINRVVNGNKPDKTGFGGIGKLRSAPRDYGESATFTFYDICRVFRPLLPPT